MGESIILVGIAQPEGRGGLMKNLDVWAVHLLTASGAALALGAALAAAHDHWQLAFLWLGLALIVDGIDGRAHHVPLGQLDLS